MSDPGSVGGGNQRYMLNQCLLALLLWVALSSSGVYDLTAHDSYTIDTAQVCESMHATLQTIILPNTLQCYVD